MSRLGWNLPSPCPAFFVERSGHEIDRNRSYNKLSAACGAEQNRLGMNDATY
ncbi:hypothetical protein [Sporomusa silvacetica]|uniref:hypothetical protein n=1 Tax=Sporomusa silvacetica TaxID=55504 RepID=UPI00146DC1B1|nr:hypothetical protein [Sporomusa silvacetica]